MAERVATPSEETAPVAAPTPVDRDYVLGTHDAEIARLGIQHEAWRPIVLDCWTRAGIMPGWRVIDVGAGPGCAAVDLARIVGPGGSVTAVERSSRFIDAGRAAASAAGLENVRFHEMDLMTDPLPEGPYDAAWCRWVASFVESPERLIDGMARVLPPGGVAVFHEYADYGLWRYSPSRPTLEEYIRRVMGSWRAAGGEPDVGMSIPPMLREAGFAIRQAVPRVYCVRPGDRLWTWISSFVDLNLRRLADLEDCDTAWVASVRGELQAAEDDPGTLMLTPTVLEVIAERLA